jgi:2,5-diamino-6-(ribosylamino)-4(3H)-pyrimidinone 5'-phosphate reductase
VDKLTCIVDRPIPKDEMRPYITFHMFSSVDGKIDCASLKGLTPTNEYEVIGALLNGDAWISGRATMQQHLADTETFVPASPIPDGPQPVHVARRAKSYAVAVDTIGELRCSSSPWLNHI